MRPGYCISCEQRVPEVGKRICSQCEKEYADFKQAEWDAQIATDYVAIHICSKCCHKQLTNGEMAEIARTCGRECK